MGHSMMMSQYIVGSLAIPSPSIHSLHLQTCCWQARSPQIWDETQSSWLFFHIPSFIFLFLLTENTYRVRLHSYSTTMHLHYPYVDCLSTAVQLKWMQYHNAAMKLEHCNSLQRRYRGVWMKLQGYDSYILCSDPVRLWIFSTDFHTSDLCSGLV